MRLGGVYETRGDSFPARGKSLAANMGSQTGENPNQGPQHQSYRLPASIFQPDTQRCGPRNADFTQTMLIKSAYEFLLLMHNLQEEN